MAVWSKVQGSTKSWSKLKRVCLNCIIQSAVGMCHTECRYKWRLPAYLGDIFLQGVHFSFSESFCDLEPAQWERNSVQLLHCWILNKRVCVCVYNLSIDPHGLVKSSKTLSRRLLSWQILSISLEEATNVRDRREDPWRTLISWVGTEGFEGVGTTCRRDQADVWVEVVGRDYWCRGSTDGI